MSRAIWYALAAVGLLSFMDAVIKAMTARFATAEIAFLRFAFGTIACVVIAALVRPSWPTREALRVNGLRSILIAITASSFFYALGALPLGEAVALWFLSPLFIVVFGGLFLGERVSVNGVVALAAGFAGMLVMASSHIGASQTGHGWLAGALAALLSALTYAIVAVLLRSRANRDSTTVILLIQNGGPALLLAAPAALDWTPPDAADLAQFGLIGLLAVAGHWLLVKASALAQASTLAPIEYVNLVWAVLFGYVFFGEVPGSTTIAGAGLIVLATVAAGRH